MEVFLDDVPLDDAYEVIGAAGLTSRARTDHEAWRVSLGLVLDELAKGREIFE
jgi:hypothetical protein